MIINGQNVSSEEELETAIASLGDSSKALLRSIFHGTSLPAPTLAEQMKNYLNEKVFPFIEDLIAVFAAENISMGITQAGKTSDVLGLFEKQYSFDKSLMGSSGMSIPVSLKGSFDTGSLYVSIAIIQHIRNNPSEYLGLSPFINDERLLKMKNSIEAFLGIPPTT